MELPNLSELFGTDEAPQDDAKDAVSDVVAQAFAEPVNIQAGLAAFDEAVGLASGGTVQRAPFNEQDAEIMAALSAFNVTENPPQPTSTAASLADSIVAGLRDAVWETMPQEEWMAQFAPVEAPPKPREKDVRARAVTEKPERKADAVAHNVLARRIGSLIEAGDDVDTVVDKCRPNLSAGKFDWAMVLKWAGEHLHSFSPIQSGDIRLAVRDEVIGELAEIEELGLDAESHIQTEGPAELLERTGQSARNLDLWIPDEAEGKSEQQRARMAHYIKLRNRPDKGGWIIKGSIGNGPQLTLETITGPRCNEIAEKYLVYCQQAAKRGMWPRRLQELMEEEGATDYA